MRHNKKTFNENEMKAFDPTEKVGLIASVTPEGLPHITLLTTIQAIKPDKMIFGEFSKGLSKDYVQKNNNVGFLIMTLDRKMWIGKAKWTHTKKEGPEYVLFNEKPMFRYNTYFGINTVHYLDLIETSESQSLPQGSIVIAALLTRFSKGGAITGINKRILKPFGEGLFNSMTALKFISYINDNGFPEVIPVIQCVAADSRRLSFSSIVYNEELKKIPEGSTVAVFGLTLQMEDILVRGIFNGVKRFRGVQLGTVDINWVYNSMPPCHGQVYPETELKPVVSFYS